MPAHGTETAADNTGGQKGDLHPYDGQADDSGKALSLLYEAQAVLCDLRSRETVFSKLTEKRKVICMKLSPKNDLVSDPVYPADRADRILSFTSWT